MPFELQGSFKSELFVQELQKLEFYEQKLNGDRKKKAK